MKTDVQKKLFLLVCVWSGTFAGLRNPWGGHRAPAGGSVAIATCRNMMRRFQKTAKACRMMYKKRSFFWYIFGRSLFSRCEVDLWAPCVGAIRVGENRVFRHDASLSEHSESM